MTLQLIFVVETNKKCKSDWIYIKETIDHFYEYNQTQVKFSPVYMDGKGKYKNKNKENQSKVIYCFDCDEYDCKPEDKKFLDEAKKYCKENNYDFIWFCKDIECVYLGDKVENHQKRDKAAGFKAHKGIKKIDEKKLTSKKYRTNTSNIMNVINQYLTRKSL